MAQKVREKFGEAVDLKIHTNDSMEALKYDIKSSTSVFVNGELLSLETALSLENMEGFLKSQIETFSGKNSD